jgi:hypothetical protein
MVPVISREIVTQKVDDKLLYEVQDFSLTESGLFISGKTATTACTPVAMITGNPDVLQSNRNAFDDQKDLIKVIREIPADKLLPKESALAKIIKQAKRLSGRALDEAVAAIDMARKKAESF